MPVSAARAGARLRGWIRPFWAGCAVGGLVAGWLATGWMPMAPAGASAVVPDAGDLAVQTDRPRSEVITDELFAAPAALPPPALAVASGAPAPPPVRNLPPPARNLPAPVRSLPSAAVTPPPRPPAPARFEGSLAVHSTPARARVFVNGEPMGLTPVVITGLPIGSRAVRVEADDHEPWWSVVQVVAHRETSVRVLLPPAASAAAP